MVRVQNPYFPLLIAKLTSVKTVFHTLNYLVLAFAFLSCQPPSNCTKNQELDDTFPDAAIAEAGYTKCVLSLSENKFDSITDEVFFETKGGHTVKWISYNLIKSDSFRTVQHFYYKDGNPRVLEKVVDIKAKYSMTTQIDRLSGESSSLEKRMTFDTTRITEFKAAKTMDYYYNDDTLTLFTVFPKNEDGFEIGYREYTDDSVLVQYSTFNTNTHGYVKEANMYKSDSTLLAHQINEYQGCHPDPISEKRYVADTLVLSTTRELDQNGLPTLYIVRNPTLKRIIEYEYLRNPEGLILKEVFRTETNGKYSARDTIFYHYMK